MQYEKKRALALLVASISLLLVVAFFFRLPDLDTVKQATEPDPEPERIRSSIVVQIAGRETSMSAKLKEGSSLYDLMEEFKKQEKLSYSQTSYTYGDVVDSINGVSNDPTRGWSWSLYVDGVKIAAPLREVALEKNKVYYWKYEPTAK